MDASLKGNVVRVMLCGLMTVLFTEVTNFHFQALYIRTFLVVLMVSIIKEFFVTWWAEKMLQTLEGRRTFLKTLAMISIVGLLVFLVTTPTDPNEEEFFDVFFTKLNFFTLFAGLFVATLLTIRQQKEPVAS